MHEASKKPISNVENAFLDPNRLFSSNSFERMIAHDLYEAVKDLPIISPHGHTDPIWFAENRNFDNATELFLAPDHYIFRLLYSQGVNLDDIGVASRAGPSNADARKAWHIFAKNFHLLYGTASHIWLNHAFADVFGFEEELNSNNADFYFDKINEDLAKENFKPRALFERFNIEVLSTTENPLDDLRHHKKIKESGWSGRVISAYRPDNVTDPTHENFAKDIEIFGEISGENIGNFKGYLKAHRVRRQYFKETGVTSSDHGHFTALTADLSAQECEDLYQIVLKGAASEKQKMLFSAQMLTEFAAMSIDDGLTMQIHAGAYRNHNKEIFEKYGRDKGGDHPSKTDYINDLRPLLNKFGNRKDLKIILFTLDETTYSRELAPMAGHYPCLLLGPAWWFNDCPEGMLRFREQTTPYCGFYNSVGFNDDTRAFLSIPARHDMARRIDARFLASLVASHRLTKNQAIKIIQDLTYKLPKAAYKL